MRKIIPGKLVAPLAGARPAALVLLAAIVWLHALNPAPVDILRTRVFDLYQNIRPRPPLEQSPVAIADIDEKSLEVYGQWPWPRTLIARVVQAMKDAGALVIGFDVVFAEGDRTSPEYASRFMAGLDELTFEKLQALPRNDVILARRLREVKAVLGQPVTGHARAAGNDRPRKTSVNTIGDVVDFIPHSPGLVRNVEELEVAAAGLGLFSLLPERDGIIRRVPAVMRVADTIYPTLSLELMRVALGRTSIDIRARPEVGIDAVRIADFVIPTDRLGRLWVYFAPRDTLRTYSVHDILSGKIAPEELKNRIVVLGTSAAGLLDVQATPLDGAVPGVEVHVQILDMILSGNHLHRPGWARSAETLVTLLAGLLLVLSVPLLGAVTSLAASGGVAAALAGGSWWLFHRHGILFDASYPIIAAMLVFGLLTFWSYLREETEKRRIRTMFGQYMSPALVEELSRRPDRLQLGGETRELTMLFCDVRDFTSISEGYKSDPQGLAAIVNRLLTPLSEAILEHKGTIDKYIGDCVMAFWNAPMDDPDHRAHACEAALAMHEALERLNAELREEAAANDGTFVPFKMGTGVNSGQVIVGNIGSEIRFDYSVLGDAVNLASRLETQSKIYGVDTIVGEDTARPLEERFALLELDRVAVPGKTESRRIFALMGGADRAATPAFRALRKRNGEMLAAYREERWADAEALARELRELPDGPGGTYYELFLERIAELRDRAPAGRSPS